MAVCPRTIFQFGWGLLWNQPIYRERTRQCTQGWKKGVPLTEKPVRQKGSRITILVLKKLGPKGSLSLVQGRSLGHTPFTVHFTLTRNLVGPPRRRSKLAEHLIR